VLNVVTADKNEPAAAIDGRRIDDREAGLSAARGANPDSRPAEAADDPSRHADQDENDQERKEELDHQRQFYAKQAVEHRYSPALRVADWRPMPAFRLMNAARTARPNHTKLLTQTRLLGRGH
jgi:hypothetical protein